MQKDLEAAVSEVVEREGSALPALTRGRIVRMVVEAVRDHASEPRMMGTLQRQFEEIMAEEPSPRLPPMQQQNQHHGGNR